MRRLAGLTALCMVSLVMAGAAQAQAPMPPQTPPPARPPAAKPKPPAAPVVDPAYEAARAAFEALPEPLRKGVQDAMVWTGDFNAVVSGGFGRRTYEGLLSWQQRNGTAPTGMLSATDRAALDAAGEAARRAMRFTVQADPASGAVIGVPEKLLSKKTPLPRGTRWQSADGRLTLDTSSSPAGAADLDGLFERATVTTPERRVTYKLRKPDFLVVTGETPTGRFYIRHAAGADGIRGFTMSYDKALAAEADRLVIAVANSFVPFPAAQTTPEAHIAARLDAAAAVLGTGGAKTTTAKTTTAKSTTAKSTTVKTPSPPAAPFAPPPLLGLSARPAATGLALGNGRVLTAAAALETCPSPQIGDAPAKVALRDSTGALALLESGQRAQAAPLPAIRAEPPASGEALVVLGAEAKGAAVAPGTAGTASVVAPLQPGAGGAPVLDRSGRLVGLVARFPTAPRLIDGVMPPTSYALVPASAVAAFLAQAGIASGTSAPAEPGAGTLGAAAAPVLGAVIAIGCGR